MTLGNQTRILLVEDIDMMATVITAQLRGMAFERIEHCRDGEQALVRIEATPAKDPFGLIFLDLGLPGISGLEVLKKCRLNPALSRTPIIMLTGSGDRNSVMSALTNGAADYIVKPCSPAILRGKIDHLNETFFKNRAA